MTSLFDPDREVPEAVRAGPFLSVFVVHGIANEESYLRYQAVSDGKSHKPSEYGGDVIGFSKPVFRFVGPEDAHALAVIRWPNFESFAAWRTQPVYAADGVAELHMAAERESVYFLPCV